MIKYICDICEKDSILSPMILYDITNRHITKADALKHTCEQFTLLYISPKTGKPGQSLGQLKDGHICKECLISILQSYDKS